MVINDRLKKYLEDNKLLVEFKLDMAGPSPKDKATEMVDKRNSGPLIYVRAIDGDCWFLDGHTAGVNIEWLVDSGAGHSLIDYTKFMEIAPAKRPSLRPCPFRLR